MAAPREYLYALLISATVILLIAGLAAFWAAVSLLGYFVAAGIFGAAALFLGARRLEPGRAGEDLDAFIDYVGSKKKEKS